MRKIKSKNKHKVDWARIISLSAAGQYIQNELNKELTKIKTKL